jgi:hypothetical protein
MSLVERCVDGQHFVVRLVRRFNGRNLNCLGFKLCIEFECDLLLQSSMEIMTVVHEINRWYLEILKSRIPNK